MRCSILADVKYAERRYSIPTQCIRVGTVNNVNTKNQRLTLGNIGSENFLKFISLFVTQYFCVILFSVNKSNVKLGGINYSISITNRA